MKTVYICSPYRGSAEEIAENVRVAQKACKIALMCGHAPVAPHLYLPPLLSDEIPAERAVAIEVCSKLVSLCDIVWVIGSNLTDGMRSEIDFANYLGKRIIKISLEELEFLSANQSDENSETFFFMATSSEDKEDHLKNIILKIF